ncbi:MAG: hypothetical protein ACR2IK_06080 [Chloroflexota bacterium]
MPRRNQISRTRTVIAGGPQGQARTFRLAPVSMRHLAYRGLALAILGLDVATLAGQLHIDLQPSLTRAA